MPIKRVPAEEPAWKEAKARALAADCYTGRISWETYEAELIALHHTDTNQAETPPSAPIETPVADTAGNKARGRAWRRRQAAGCRRAIRFGQVDQRHFNFAEGQRLIQWARRHERKTKRRGSPNGDLGAKGIAVLVALVGFYHRNGHMRLNLKLLAALAQCSQSTAQVAIKRLEHAGFLLAFRCYRLVRQRNGGALARKDRNSYTPRMIPPPDHNPHKTERRRTTDDQTSTKNTERRSTRLESAPQPPKAAFKAAPAAPPH